jgi:hypothetical protein
MHRGDSVSVMAFSTLDLSRRASDEEFALWYHTPMLKAGRNRIRLGATWQRLIYPSVLTGTRDWATGGQLQFSRNLGSVPIVLTTDVRTNFASHLRRGIVLVSNLSTSRRLWGSDRQRLILRHGPSFAHAYGIYGTHGLRQWRYNGSLVWEQGRHAFEFAGRKQFGLQPRIPDNPYWCVNWTVGFGRR